MPLSCINIGIKTNEIITELSSVAQTVKWEVWNAKSPEQQEALKQKYPNLKVVGDFTLEERDAKRIAAMEQQKIKRSLKAKTSLSSTS